jgi:hypothetical protein
LAAGTVAGIAIAGGLLAVVAVAGLLPPGATGFAIAGALVGAAVAALSSCLNLHAARATTGAGIQAGLGLGFVVKLLALALGAAVLALSGVKFADTATFAVAFAVVALIVQAAGTLQLVRAMRRPADPRR